MAHQEAVQNSLLAIFYPNENKVRVIYSHRLVQHVKCQGNKSSEASRTSISLEIITSPRVKRGLRMMRRGSDMYELSLIIH